MRDLEKESIYYSSSRISEDHYSDAGHGRGGVGTSTTHLSSHIVNFGRYRHDGFFVHLRVLAQHTI